MGDLQAFQHRQNGAVSFISAFSPLLTMILLAVGLLFLLAPHAVVHLLYQHCRGGYSKVTTHECYSQNENI